MQTSVEEKSERIKTAFDYIKMKGLVTTQEDLAKKLGYDKATISQAFNASERHLTDALISKFCKIFTQINENWILGTNENMLKSDITQNNVEGDNIQGKNVTVSKSQTDKFLDLLQAKDEQINRLIGIIEKINS
jgi:plasmid maintenance system antidote protein VapI